MLQIKIFTFNPFQENTYLLFDETKECVIIDPGCYVASEEKMLEEYVSNQGLKPVRLLNTHGHIDHIFGNSFVKKKWGVPFATHEGEAKTIQAADEYAMMLGVPAPNSPAPDNYLDEGDEVNFGNTTLKVLFAPGHSAAHIVFVSEPVKIVIGGDVLFRESIGRTDLPGGNHDLLLKNIKEKLYSLPNDYTVYPGHGPETTIGYEKKYNPFVRG